MFDLAPLLIIAAVAFVARCNQPIAPPRLGDRIVEGHDVNITEHPYQVALCLNKKLHCGGSIIGRRHVVTAAQCTTNRELTDMTIRVGSSYVDRGGYLAKPLRVHRHPKYNRSTYDYNIAVVELHRELTLGPAVGIVDLPDANHRLKVDAEATITGWGHLLEIGINPLQLQGATVRVVNATRCKTVYKKRFRPGRMICAGNGGADTCKGDTGGPLVAQNLLYGITSWGMGCGRVDFPGVYTEVAKMRHFIKYVSGI